jgi:two-component system, chemotaxis family, CheB/CheR fusion protein
MPRSAIASGCVDFVLPPAEIARELVRIAQHPYVAAPDQPPAQEPAPEASLEQVLQIVRNVTGVDFNHYKPNSLNRRINRRLVLHKLGGLDDYVRFLRRNPLEVEALYQDILINVTSFFRDPEAFDALKSKVFPKLTQDRSRHSPIRIWVVGCSTGEETYSIAMTYCEFAQANGIHVPVQIFATDLNAAGIDKARAGIYPKNIAQDVSPDRLRRFFVEVDGAYRIGKPIRDMCVFARHNILAEPPFSRIDLLSCRNMMIYLDQSLQQKVVPILHYALKPRGFLWLGASETIGAYRELFDVQDVRRKIYVKKAAGGGAPTTLPHETTLETAPASRVPPPHPRPAPLSNDLHREADRLMLSRYAPAAVLLNADLDIVQFRGDTGPYLAPAPGKASFNVLKMAREGLLVGLRGAIHKARREEQPVREKNLRVKDNGGYRGVSIEVVPLRSAATREACLLVLFEEQPTILRTPAKKARAATGRSGKGRSAGPKASKADSAEQQIARLTQELAATREYLQSVIEQQEAANEELQSANEEVQSANEELQSINEELETSKEEIQSSNEELATVNDELQNRNLELSHSNNDMMNLLSSVQMAIVMLGRDLRIRRFTPAAEKAFNLIPADVGRPVGDIKLNLNVSNFEELVAEVIDTVTGKELDVQDARGRWHLLRVRPYKTLESQIDGAVLVLVDIDNFRRLQEDLRQRVAELAEADRAKNEFLAMLAHELRNPLAPLLNGVELLKAVGGAAGGAARLDAGLIDETRAMMEHQIRNLTRMVDDLLDVARVTQGKVQLRTAGVELTPILRAALEVNRRLIDERELKVALDLPTAPVWLDADGTRLEQVFTNIVNNAAKFSQRGGRIWISAEHRPRQAPEAVVRVRDEGLGIAAETLPRVFDLFAQGDRSTGRSEGGLGIGLTLVRNLVEMHGGTVRAVSEGLGKGAEFIVELPALAAAPAQGSPPASRGAPAAATTLSAGSGQPRRVLVVDDNADAADSLALLLRMQGHQAVSCHSGDKAVEALAAGPFDVALLDISMPGMDGLELAKLARSKTQGRPPRLVAVSGYSHEDSRRAAQGAGFDDFLTKPAELSVVLELLAKL